MQYHDREANMIKSKMFELLLTKYVVGTTSGNNNSAKVCTPPATTIR